MGKIPVKDKGDKEQEGKKCDIWILREADAKMRFKISGFYSRNTRVGKKKKFRWLEKARTDIGQWCKSYLREEERGGLIEVSQTAV